ncbi:hypothetical protein MNBD_UNCLBAC01-1375 [hydrothermal vent metagenome]|uniref:SSU ribosomal protein S6p n=1 Tax=hydrothermal vent metagenome TaxID=652676 RepID=A0A3B1D3Y2_9ZZZZ
MEKTVLKKYEMVVIIDAKLTNEEKEVARKDATEIVNNAGGNVINSQVWIEKQKFTFEIKKCTEGLYYSINFESEASAINKMRAGLRLNEQILRSLIILVD